MDVISYNQPVGQLSKLSRKIDRHDFVIMLDDASNHGLEIVDRKPSYGL